jgi:hypothetical protein
MLICICRFVKVQSDFLGCLLLTLCDLEIAAMLES